MSYSIARFDSAAGCSVNGAASAAMTGDNDGSLIATSGCRCRLPDRHRRRQEDAAGDHHLQLPRHRRHLRRRRTGELARVPQPGRDDQRRRANDRRHLEPDRFRRREDDRLEPSVGARAMTRPVPSLSLVQKESLMSKVRGRRRREPRIARRAGRGTGARPVPGPASDPVDLTRNRLSSIAPAGHAGTFFAEAAPHRAGRQSRSTASAWSATSPPTTRPAPRRCGRSGSPDRSTSRCRSLSTGSTTPASTTRSASAADWRWASTGSASTRS